MFRFLPHGFFILLIYCIILAHIGSFSIESIAGESPDLVRIMERWQTIRAQSSYHPVFYDEILQFHKKGILNEEDIIAILKIIGDDAPDITASSKRSFLSLLENIMDTSEDPDLIINAGLIKDDIFIDLGGFISRREANLHRIARFPDSGHMPEILRRKGDFYFQIRSISRANRIYDNLIRNYSDYRDIRHVYEMLIETSILLERYREAGIFLNRYRSAMPLSFESNPDNFFNLGKINYLQNNIDGAYEFLDLYLSRAEPEAVNYPQALYYKSIIQKERNELNRAYKGFLNIIEMMPSDDIIAQKAYANAFIISIILKDYNIESIQIEERIIDIEEELQRLLLLQLNTSIMRELEIISFFRMLYRKPFDDIYRAYERLSFLYEDESEVKEAWINYCINYMHSLFENGYYANVINLYNRIISDLSLPEERLRLINIISYIRLGLNDLAFFYIKDIDLEDLKYEDKTFLLENFHFKEKQDLISEFLYLLQNTECIYDTNCINNIYDVLLPYLTFPDSGIYIHDTIISILSGEIDDSDKLLYLSLLADYYSKNEEWENKNRVRKLIFTGFQEIDREKTSPYYERIMYHINGIIDDAGPEETLTYFEQLQNDDIQSIYSSNLLKIFNIYNMNNELIKGKNILNILIEREDDLSEWAESMKKHLNTRIEIRRLIS